MYKNIIIGIDESSDIEQLLADGIRQFYFGYIPAQYLQTYSSQTSLNRRYRVKEQFTSLEPVNRMIDQIHQHQGTVYLALNAFTSNDIMLKYSEELYELLADRVDGIIVANIATASMLKKRSYRNIVISNLFGVYTPQSVTFLQKQFNPIKIILPRDISLGNIEEIVTAFPKQEFECFLYGDNCRYSESFCFTEHGYDSTGFGSLCSFASSQKQLVKAATPTFKHIVKDPKLSDEEKRKQLQKQPLDIASLLDECQVALYDDDFSALSKVIDILGRYDIENFMLSKALYVRAVALVKNIDTPNAKQLYTRLEEHGYKEQDKYRSFHNLNSRAISETLAFFEKFDNIVSYKIPSRGRDLYKHLLTNDRSESYNYKESQYRL